MSLKNNFQLQSAAFLVFVASLLSSCGKVDLSKKHTKHALRESESETVEVTEEPQIPSEPTAIIDEASIDTSDKDERQTSEPIRSPLFLLGKADDCLNIISSFSDRDAFVLSNEEFLRRFSLIKDLRGVSKSGAFPSIVVDKRDNVTRFLKVFPSVPPGWPRSKIVKDPNFLEVFQTCRLAKLNLDSHLPPSKTAAMFFVDVYESGFVHNLDPFSHDSSKQEANFPFLLSEAVQGITLTQLVTDPEKAELEENLGFSYLTAPPMVLESILMQIMIALKNPNLAWDLVHNDLHPGNIMLSKHEKADFVVDYDGKKMQLTGPLIKIIDFGLGESEAFKQSGLTFDVWIKNRTFIQELERFIEKARGTKGISWITRRKIGLMSENQDIRMFNLILTSLKFVLRDRGSDLPERATCKSYDDCIELMSRWWK